MNEWARDDINYVGFDELTTYIEEKGNIEEFEVSELKLFYETIIEKEHDGLFSSKNLLYATSIVTYCNSLMCCFLLIIVCPLFLDFGHTRLFFYKTNYIKS